MTTADKLDDLRTYVRGFGSATGQSADHLVQSRCSACDGTRFWMEVSEEDGVARRTCTGCKLLAYIGDSEELWDDADVGDAMCPCGRKVFDIVVGYCLADNGEVNWMVVGAKCAACAEVGVYADWSIEYEPSRELLERA
jgi:hypothetical protein